MNHSTALVISPSTPEDTAFPLLVPSAQALHERLCFDGDFHDEVLDGNNQFFRRSCLRIHDLDVYSEPAANALRLMMKGAHGEVSDSEILRTVREIMSLWRRIDDALERENAA